jgi:Peptidase family M28
MMRFLTVRRRPAPSSLWLGAPLLALALFPGPGLARTVKSPPARKAKDLSSALNPAVFDGARAFRDLKAQVEFGPRPAGSDALAKTRAYIEHDLASSGIRVEEDKFTASTPIGPLGMANLIVRIPGESPGVVIVCGHYDTKRFSQFRFVGANDGASSAALLMELARDLAGKRLPYALWLVWFDGEEAVRQQWQGEDNDYGSRHMVESLSAEGKLDRVKALILVDMIGDAQLDVRRDPGSTPWLTSVEFGAASRLGYDRYFLAHQDAAVGGDDYDPWLAAGVPSVDLIDFNYGPNARASNSDRDWNIYWHTAEDTVEHCSAASLEIVGRVVLGMLQDLETSPHVHP